MKLTEKDFARWETIRTRGGLWFVLVRGVLCYGVLGAITWSILFTFLLPLLLNGVNEFSFPEFTRTLRLALIFWPLGGFFLSLWLWHYLEDAYYERRRKAYL
jgi:hypothetical protein